jgi:hypothetical protein
MTSTNDFPTTGVELRYLLVVSDYARSLPLYREVLGATVVRQISDVLWHLLSWLLSSSERKRGY